MSKQSFDYLIEKYLDGTATDEEKKLVEQWYALVGDSSQIPVSSKEWLEIKERIWRKISLKTIKKRVYAPLPKRAIFAAAASVVFLLGMGLWFLNRPPLSPQTEPTENQEITITNNQDKAKKVVLSDNSVVTLEKNASITYLRIFKEGKRAVKLSGEAFFEITKDSSKPFTVEAANTITRVLGTSFSIKEHKGEDVRIEVTSGLVSVYDKKSTDKKNNGVLLTANQKVTFHETENHFVLGLIEKPKPLAKESADAYTLKYENTALSAIKAELEKIYGIDILLEKNTIGMCKITGDLSGESLYDTLDIISLILNTDYQVQGTSILITGKGC